MTSVGNNFNDFSENQLTIDFAFLFKPTWANATISPSPLSWYHLGKSVPQKYFGKRRFPALPLDYTTGYARLITCKLSDIATHTHSPTENLSAVSHCGGVGCIDVSEFPTLSIQCHLHC